MKYGNWSPEQLEQLADAYTDRALREQICEDNQSARLFDALLDEGFDLSNPEETEFGVTIYHHKAREFALKWEEEIEALCSPGTGKSKYRTTAGL